MQTAAFFGTYLHGRRDCRSGRCAESTKIVTRFCLGAILPYIFCGATADPIAVNEGDKGQVIRVFSL